MLENLIKDTLIETVIPEVTDSVGECIEHFEEVENVERLDSKIEAVDSKTKKIDDNSQFKDSFDKDIENNDFVERVDEKNEFVEALDKNSKKIEFVEALDINTEKNEFVEALDINTEKVEFVEAKDKNTEKNEFVEALDTEKIEFVEALDINTEIIEFVEALNETIAQNIPETVENQIVDETKTLENSPVREIPAEKSFDDSKWNKVTVEVESPTQGSMKVRLSMESLPTSSKSADAMQQQLEDSNIPVVVEKYDHDSLRASNDSLASCSLPNTPTVSRSNSRMSDGRAGKYNKLPAPIRPESPVVEESPMKARLVLKPGVLRQLPETLGESSQVFLPTGSKDKKKKKHKSNLTSLFPFWQGGSNSKSNDDKDSEGSKTKATNL
jgi:hypothetical protein